MEKELAEKLRARAIEDWSAQQEQAAAEEARVTPELSQPFEPPAMVSGGQDSVARVLALLAILISVISLIAAVFSWNGR